MLEKYRNDPAYADHVRQDKIIIQRPSSPSCGTCALRNVIGSEECWECRDKATLANPRPGWRAE